MPLPNIAFTNESTVVTDDEVKRVVDALQKQVTRDVKGFWNLDADLYFMPKTEVLPEGHYQIVVIDDPDLAGALGYHELNANGGPLGKIFAKLDIQTGQSWSNTSSHELLEMLVDPWIYSIAEGRDGRLYALEVCDAVEADELGYEIDGVLVSDFVTPSWFSPTWHKQVDFKNHISRPLELAPGGYISILDPKNGWTQIDAHTAEGLPIKSQAILPIGSRRQRRALNRELWRPSARKDR